MAILDLISYVHLPSFVNMLLDLYMEAKFGPLEKGIKRLTSIEIKFFRTAVCTPFGHKRKEEVLKELKVKLVDQKLRRYKSY
jgi:hypothetical protein